MTIKNTSKPINRSVLDKLDNVVNDDEEGPKLDDSPTGKRKPVEPSSEPARSVPKPERKEKKKSQVQKKKTEKKICLKVFPTKR